MQWESLVAFVILIVIFLASPIACGMIATKRGYSSGVWVWRGALLGVFGVLWACFMKDRNPKPQGVTLDMPLPPTQEDGKQ